MKDIQSLIKIKRLYRTTKK